MLLVHGAVEANPLSSILLASQSLLWVKLGLLAVLGFKVVYSRPRLGVMGVACFAAGIYATGYFLTRWSYIWRLAPEGRLTSPSLASSLYKHPGAEPIARHEDLSLVEDRTLRARDPFLDPVTRPHA
jgi:hypothetical protein